MGVSFRGIKGDKITNFFIIVKTISRKTRSNCRKAVVRPYFLLYFCPKEGFLTAMNIIALDDEKIALEALMSAIIKAAPGAEVHGFRNLEGVETYLADNSIDVLFMDIELRGDVSGIEFAEELTKEYPKLNIIFTTGYSDYALKAVELHCSGYIVKPVTLDKVRLELEKLRYPIDKSKQGLYVRCFGNFEVFLDGKPLNFKYKKTRELLAYLIDRRGSLCRNNEIISTLWEDDRDNILYRFKGRSERQLRRDQDGRFKRRRSSCF